MLEIGSVAFIMITLWYCPLLGILRALNRDPKAGRAAQSRRQRSILWRLGIFYYYHRRRRRRSPCFSCPSTSAFLGRTHTHTKNMRSASVCVVVATSAFCCLFTTNVDHIFCLVPFLLCFSCSPLSLHVLLLHDGDNDSCSRLPSPIPLSHLHILPLSLPLCSCCVLHSLPYLVSPHSNLGLEAKEKNGKVFIIVSHSRWGCTHTHTHTCTEVYTERPLLASCDYLHLQHWNSNLNPTQLGSNQKTSNSNSTPVGLFWIWEVVGPHSNARLVRLRRRRRVCCCCMGRSLSMCGSLLFVALPPGLLLSGLWLWLCFALPCIASVYVHVSVCVCVWVCFWYFLGSHVIHARAREALCTVPALLLLSVHVCCCIKLHTLTHTRAV